VLTQAYLACHYPCLALRRTAQLPPLQLLRHPVCALAGHRRAGRAQGCPLALARWRERAAT
jgi:hypothetical protein